MHWVIQNNLYNEKGIDELIQLLDRAEIPYSLHKITPLIGDLEPDINPPGNVICIGMYSMRHVAHRKGWMPGVFDLNRIDFSQCVAHWGDRMLNADRVETEFQHMLDYFDNLQDDSVVFVRPTMDSKFIAGDIYTRENLAEMIDNLRRLGKKADPAGIQLNSPIMMSAPKNIAQEYRTWIVDGRVVTASLYKIGGRVRYNNQVDEQLLAFAQDCANLWCPARAWVLDVAVMRNGSLRIVEINTFNAAGLYAANVGKIVEAIEAMQF